MAAAIEVNRAIAGDEQEVFVASQWQLMWRKFLKHRVAVIAGIVLLFFYGIAAFAEFLSMGDPAVGTHRYHLLQPQTVHWWDDGGFNPHVKALEGSRDPRTQRKVYAVLPDEKIPVGFFVHGFEYKLLGLFKTDRHIMGFTDPEVYEERPSPYVLGSDAVGRDQWSRLMIASRISLTIGLVGVLLAFILGVSLGALSGYYGGWVDQVIQRMIEVLTSIPTIPLWMGLAATIPRDWSVIRVYLAITVILSIISWTGMARVVRGRFLSLREEDFVMAAQLAGASQGRIIFRHMVPVFTSHIIAAATLAIPGMIITETALSYLGLGLRPPAVSWGVMLQQAQNVQTVALFPWLMFVAIPVIIVVLSFNFFGDGIRDAADPYSQ